ncbi:MAG: nucleotidyltransferase domain-containing protein [Bdellovibrionales bacterium]|nr:nucleotidyltransferase domain-containing protein [Bdellovibrionales bacterium]
MGLLKLQKIDVDTEGLVLQIRKELERSGIGEFAKSAYLVGSSVDGEMTAESDLDVVVVFDKISQLKLAQERTITPPNLEWPIEWILLLANSFDRDSQVGGIAYIAKNHGIKIL